MFTSDPPSLTKVKKAVSELINLAPDNATTLKALLPLRTLKLYGRGGDYQVETLADHLLLRYKRNHAQVRLSLLEILAHLLERSRHLRQYLAHHLDTLMALSLHPSKGDALPPPREYADLLHVRTCALLEKWSHDYGSLYPNYRWAHLSIKDSALSEQVSVNVNPTRVELPNSPPRQVSGGEVSPKDLESKSQVKTTKSEQPKIPTFEPSAELEALLSRGETLLEAAVPKLLGLEGEASEALPPRHDTVYQTLLSSGLGSKRYQLEVHLNDELDISPAPPPEAREELIAIYQALSCRFQLLVFEHVATYLREGVTDERLGLVLDFQTRIGDLLARCQAMQLHTAGSNAEPDSEVEFEEVLDGSIPQTDHLQPWELLEESVCQQNGLPFLRDVALPPKAPPPRVASNLVRRKPPSALERLNAKLVNYRGAH